MSYDVRKFLAELFGPKAAEGPVELDTGWRAWYEERAAIMEFCGNLPRERAEALAWAETVRAMRKSGKEDTLTCQSIR